MNYQLLEDLPPFTDKSFKILGYCVRHFVRNTAEFMRKAKINISTNIKVIVK
jgi:hypothetical protein